MSSEPYTAQQIDDCLTALIAWNGNATAAVRYLKGEKKRAPAAPTLSKWARVDEWERYEQLRERLADGREKQLAHDFMEAAARARDVAFMAIDQAEERLEQKKDPEPAKTAAALARASQSFTEKGLTLQGKPSRITETVDVEARVRKLVAMGVIHLPDGGQPALEPGDVE